MSDTTEIVYKISEPDRKPNIADLLFEGKIDFIINVPSTSTLEKYVGMLYDEYQIRRKSLELGIPVLTTPEIAEYFSRQSARVPAQKKRGPRVRDGQSPDRGVR